ALAGTAAFLSWPVWVGPPIATFVIVAFLRHREPTDVQMSHIAIAVVPVAAVALVHTIHHLGGAGIARTSGAVISPTSATLGWPFIALGVPGLLVAAFDRRARTVALLTATIGAQAAVLFAVARSSHADTPYLSLKMFYLAIY